MIRSNAWGSLPSDAESTTEGYSQSHDEDYEDDQLMDTEGYSMTSYEGQSLSESGSVNEGLQGCELDFQHGQGIQQSADDTWNASHQDNRSYSSASASPWQRCDDDFGTGFAGNVVSLDSSNDVPLIPTTHSSVEQLNVSVRRSIREQEQERNHGVSMDDTDDHLPELTVSFTDPEGCRFDEILYWVRLNKTRRRERKKGEREMREGCDNGGGQCTMLILQPSVNRADDYSYTPVTMNAGSVISRQKTMNLSCRTSLSFELLPRLCLTSAWHLKRRPIQSLVCEEERIKLSLVQTMILQEPWPKGCLCSVLN